MQYQKGECKGYTEEEMKDLKILEFLFQNGFSNENLGTYLYKDVLDAESALNEIYTRMENEDEYEVNIEKIDFNKFLDNLTKMDTPYSVETLDSLDFMLNH